MSRYAHAVGLILRASCGVDQGECYTLLVAPSGVSVTFHGQPMADWAARLAADMPLVVYQLFGVNKTLVAATPAVYVEGPVDAITRQRLEQAILHAWAAAVDSVTRSLHATAQILAAPRGGSPPVAAAQPPAAAPQPASPPAIAAPPYQPAFAPNGPKHHMTQFRGAVRAASEGARAARRAEGASGGRTEQHDLARAALQETILEGIRKRLELAPAAPQSAAASATASTSP